VKICTYLDHLAIIDIGLEINTISQSVTGTHACVGTAY